MLRDILDLPDGATIDADVAVVGSGIAGMEVAVSLARRGLSVALLESGRAAFDPAIQALNDIEFLGKPHRDLDPDAGYHPYLPPELRGVSRVRQLGGTSNVWTGKWKLFQRWDFEGRPWLADSAWPIDLDELLPHYRAAARDYGFGDLEREAERAGIAAFRREIAGAGLKLTSFYWEEEPTRTAMRFAEEIRSAPNLTVVTGATATAITLDEERAERVTGIACRSLEGRSLTARANSYVLATGALETARLLLASNDRRSAGIGNDHDLVGRFYSDHPKHHSGILRPGPLTRRYATELQYAPKPRFCVCFALADEVQRAGRLTEHVVYLKPIYARRRKWLPAALARRARDGNGTVAAYRVKFVTEQVPNRDSRATLSSERDALGVRKLRLDWRFTDQDRDSMAETLRQIETRFARAGLGRLDFGSAPPSLENTTDAAHQMGTTRMAADPSGGVVDTDCRVFGTDNLYVASSAVFPTGPSYSPTFTILALARRLAEHLAAAGAAGRAAPRARAGA
jgi:choline dehydrogenase-like flavoprotein